MKRRYIFLIFIQVFIMICSTNVAFTDQDAENKSRLLDEAKKRLNQKQEELNALESAVKEAERLTKSSITIDPPQKNGIDEIRKRYNNLDNNIKRAQELVKRAQEARSPMEAQILLQEVLVKTEVMKSIKLPNADDLLKEIKEVERRSGKAVAGPNIEDIKSGGLHAFGQDGIAPSDGTVLVPGSKIPMPDKVPDAVKEEYSQVYNAMKDHEKKLQDIQNKLDKLSEKPSGKDRDMEIYKLKQKRSEISSQIAHDKYRITNLIGPSIQPRPGGILFSRDMASKLAMNLSIRAVNYDTKTGTLTVAGEEHTHGLDPDFLATTLRLVFDERPYRYSHPYFSLEPISNEPWGERGGEMWDEFYRDVDRRVEPRLNGSPYYLLGFPCANRKNFIPWELLMNSSMAYDRISRWCPGTSIPSNLDAMSGRYWTIKKTAPKFKASDGNEYYLLGSLEQIFPDTYSDIQDHIVLTAKLEFGPEWLRETHVGEVLYIADAAIKEIYSPLSFHRGRLSRVMGLPRQVPFQVYKEEGDPQNFLGRWWLQPAGEAGQEGTFLDLSAVHAELRRVRGWLGKKDMPQLPLQEQTRHLVKDVNSRFDEYAKAITEWSQLTEIFRAYVLAVWLKEKAPGLGRRLLEVLPEPQRPREPLPRFYHKQVALFSKPPSIENRGSGAYSWTSYGIGTRVGGVSVSLDDVGWKGLTDRGRDLKALLSSSSATEPVTKIQGLTVYRFLLPQEPAKPPEPPSPRPKPDMPEDQIEVKLPSRYDLSRAEEELIAQYKSLRAANVYKLGGLPGWMRRTIPAGGLFLLCLTNFALLFLVDRHHAMRRV